MLFNPEIIYPVTFLVFSSFLRSIDVDLLEGISTWLSKSRDDLLCSCSRFSLLVYQLLLFSHYSVHLYMPFVWHIQLSVLIHRFSITCFHLASPSGPSFQRAWPNICWIQAVCTPQRGHYQNRKRISEVPEGLSYHLFLNHNLSQPLKCLESKA